MITGQGGMSGAGSGNRTRTLSLEGSYDTISPYPHSVTRSINRALWSVKRSLAGFSVFREPPRAIAQQPTVRTRKTRARRAVTANVLPFDQPNLAVTVRKPPALCRGTPVRHQRHPLHTLSAQTCAASCNTLLSCHWSQWIWAARLLHNCRTPNETEQWRLRSKLGRDSDANLA